MLAATVKSFELLYKIYTNDTLLNCLNAHLDLFILTDIACRDCLLVEPLNAGKLSDTPAVALEEGGEGLEVISTLHAHFRNCFFLGFLSTLMAG